MREKNRSPLDFKPLERITNISGRDVLTQTRKLSGDPSDAFDETKKDLLLLMVDLKQKVCESDDSMMDKNSRPDHTIRMRHSNDKLLLRVKEKYNALHRIYDRQKRKNHHPEMTLRKRKKMLEHFEGDIKEIENRYLKVESRRRSLDPRKASSHIARNRREPSLMVDESIEEASHNTHVFILEQREHDKQLDIKLDGIHDGLRRLSEHGKNMKEELKQHDEIIQHTDKEFDQVDDRFTKANTRLQTLIDDNGGARRLCVLFLASVILFFLVIYALKLVA